MRFLKSIASKALLNAALFSFILILPITIYSGVTNPDISAIGQVFGGMTDAVDSKDQGEPTLKIGEAEIVLDAYLNPFFKGILTLSGGEEGVGVEEAYMSMVKGLPYGLGIKAGKYRLGFGKVNPSHPHSYPFIAPPRSSMSLLPGEDGFNETALQISEFLPMPGDWASTLNVDVLEGKQFHPGQEKTRLGYLGRWANDFLLGDQTALETGISATTGIDDVERDTRISIFGADFKTKFYMSGASQLVIQGEGILRQGHLSDTVAGTFNSKNRMGFHTFLDYRYHTQYNGGVFFEQWENGLQATDRAFRVFAGYAVLEESTLLRIYYERFLPEVGDAVNTVSIQALFSMGPHKAHQF